MVILAMIATNFGKFQVTCMYSYIHICKLVLHGLLDVMLSVSVCGLTSSLHVCLNQDLTAHTVLFRP